MSLSLEQVEALQTTPQLANIREAECIGCTKCIQACPFDVIFGAAKQMHSVIKAECTGCALCVPACPVDCIDLIPLDKSTYNVELSRKRFHARQQRLNQKSSTPQNITPHDLMPKKAYILEAVARAKVKKNLPIS